MSEDRGKRRRLKLRLLDRVCLSLSSGEYVDGIWIGACDENPEPIISRLREALRLIKTYDPLPYKRLARDIERIWAVWIPHQTTCFDARLSACMVNPRYLLADATTLEFVASLIVHEATHARLSNWGIKYEEEARARIEAICIRRQIVFATKLPNGREARDWAEQSLSTYAIQSNLTNAALDKRHDDQAIEALRALDVPHWIVQSLLVLRAPFRSLPRFLSNKRRALQQLRSD